jgi:NAD+ synthase (glutamine-hydrolysing)
MKRQDSGLPFDSLYRHGFIRVAVAVPPVHLADPARNAEQTLGLAQRAAAEHAAVVLFPELGLSGYSLDDLFHQDALLEASREALGQVVAASAELAPLLIVGVALPLEGRLYNCAAVVHGGHLLGLVPKSYIPNYREFYEKRQFAGAHHGVRKTVRVAGLDGRGGDTEIPFGDDLLFEAPAVPGFTLHVEICEDLWAPLPPSTYAALAGAQILCNLSASNITVGKAEYRHTLTASQSGRCVAAYLYAAAGAGESTTDLAWDGHALVYENATLLAESERFAHLGEGSGESGLLTFADVDLDRLAQERMRVTSFADCAARHRGELERFRRIPFDFQPPAEAVSLARVVPRFPYVPPAGPALDARCAEVYQIQVQGLVQRLRATGIKKVVIGVSGGLDSTQALIVAARAMDRLGYPRGNVLAYTLPGFATTEHTYDNAWALMRALGVSAAEVDIRPSCRQMLADLDHPFSKGEEVYDVTFENVQAGERTSHLFRLANHHGALVLGTGDLSELALGWCTYGVGDQMSHYNVNTSVPKTLIRHLIRWEAEQKAGDATATVLRAILETEISPELVPGKQGNGQPAQSTEAIIGPYELQDFHLYYLSRFGYRPSKVAYLAAHAWQAEGDPAEDHPGYDLPTIKKWLEVFLRRFFGFSQFKRSASPNGPKVGSGGSLSPRGDWRAPSDGSAEVWLEELRRNVP